MLRHAKFRSAAVGSEPCLKDLLHLCADCEAPWPPHLVWCSQYYILGGVALAQQDKYTLQVPNGLAFSEFRGYETWQVVSMSHDGPLLAAVLANPVMIDAYLAGIPGNGKPFPDGAKLAKIHWNPKMMETFPAAIVPGTQHDMDFMVKDSKRFADSGGWGWAVFESIRSGPAPRLTSRRRRTTPSAGSSATR
jgi:hypothetical protein